MKKGLIIGCTSLLLLSAVCAGIVACSNANSAVNKEASKPWAEAVITGTKADTAVTGIIKFTQTGGKVKMKLEIMIPQLANHTVAVHIHEHGDCGDAGKNAHGHWNPGGKKHGKWGSAEFHAGDIGNITLNAKGKGTYTLESTIWSIGGDVMTDILNKAIIVHSGTDDYTSQPAGNAGSRIGCGLIVKK
jgi:Cu-Zn family superoxide dismutase